MKKLSVKEVSECCGAELRACGEVYGTMWFECGECRKHCDPSETNEAPVESVSQPKAVDGYLKEFDKYMSQGFHDHAIKFPEAENTQFESGFDVAQEIAESFLKSSIERARREERIKRLSETNETLLKVPHLQSHELDTLSSPSHNPNYTPTLDSGEEWDRVDFLIKEHNVYAGENMGLFVAKLKSLLQESREEERQRVVEMIDELRKTKRFHSTDNDFSALSMHSGYLFALSDLQSKLNLPSNKETI